MRMNDEKDNLTIGKKLHDARVAKGYTLDDLQKKYENSETLSDCDRR